MPDDEDVAAALESHLVGVGMWGTVYTAANGPRCYRLIPNDHLDAGGRAGLHELRARPRRPGVAPVVRHLAGDQQEIGRQWFQVVCYELAADWSLADSLASPYPIRRLTDMAAVLRAVPGWWARAAGFLPTPSDIAFTHQTPQLLAVPRWGVPSLRALFMAPERIGYLAPQLLLGVRDDSGRAEDMYALAVMSLRCFARLPSWEPGELMARAACSALYSSDRCESRLPSWMRRLEAVRQALAAIDALLAHDPSARATMVPTDLADLLERCVEEMDPVATVAALRAEGRAKEAMELARTVLIDDPSYELLLLAAAIAVDELGNPLEGLELLERAVLAEPRRREAYAAQFALVRDSRAVVMAQLVEAVDPSFARRLDDSVLRAFDQLSPREQRAGAHDLARYLLDRGDARRANRLVFTWLHDGDTLMWWQFDLMIDYVETFLRLGRIREARELVARIKADLTRMRESGHLPAGQIHDHGMRLAAVERLLLGEGPS